VTGQAFGPGPAKGTLLNQMDVTGFEGKGLVNTYYNGDGTTGTLTSPGFEIKRNFINFLIGGGGHAGLTCMNLLVDGNVVRTAVGPNTQPGGSEQLDRQSWMSANFRERPCKSGLLTNTPAAGAYQHRPNYPEQYQTPNDSESRACV